MNIIKQIEFPNQPLGPSIESRSYKVIGDPGAAFTVTVTNAAGQYYDFEDDSFTATPKTSNIQTISTSGFFIGAINFPAVTENDQYVITIYSQGYYETEFSPAIALKNFSVLKQFINSTLTFSLVSADDNSTYTYPSNYTSTGFSSLSLKKPTTEKISIDWTVSIDATDFIIAKQPDISDFYFTTTKTTKTAGSSSKILELNDVTGLSVGMVVSGTGIASGSTIQEINQGFLNVETGDYVVVKVINDDQSGLKNDIGGTVLISANSTFVEDRTLTFTGFGSGGLQTFNNAEFSISNFAVALSDVTTTTTAAVAAAATVIPVASTSGIKDDVSTITGVGINSDSAMTVTNIASLNLTVRALVAANNEALESGQTLTFKGASREAKITGDLLVKNHGNSNTTITLDLDNILTVS